MSLLEVKDICLSYAEQVLDNVSFSLEPASSIAIIGPSGCGKSSLLKIIQGLITPTSGTVLFNGEEVSGPVKDASLILQDFGLLPWKNCQKNVELGLKLRGAPKQECRKQAARALELVELKDVAAQYPRQLSGGMKQRLAIARALALDTKLLLMDEPLSALDALLRERMQQRMLDLWRKQGYAQVIVTHSIDEAVFLGQRIIVMSPKPSRIVQIIDNPLCAKPGYRDTDEFFSQVEHLRKLLAPEVSDE